MVPPGKQTLDVATKRYLKMVESQSEGYETLSRLITAKPESWFALSEPPKGNIVFNYYLRDRVDFIYNPQHHMASNNFYVMESKDPYLDLMTLNSSLVRNTILARARNQGDGLKKVQLYEFRDLPLPNTDLLTEKQRNDLRDLGKQLAKQPRENPDQKVIGAADRILEKKFDEPMPQTYQNAIYALV
jgi:adenine-specific DNA-methyltransferase